MPTPFDRAQQEYMSTKQSIPTGNIGDILMSVFGGLSPVLDMLSKNRRGEESLAEAKDLQHSMIAGVLDIPKVESKLSAPMASPPGVDDYAYLKDAAVLDLQNAQIPQQQIQNIDDIGAARAGGYMLMENGNLGVIDQRAYNERRDQIKPTQTSPPSALAELALAQYGVDYGKGTQIDPTMDGFRERPINRSGLPDEANRALDFLALESIKPRDNQIFQTPGGGIVAVDKETLKPTTVKAPSPETNVINGQIVSKDPNTGEWKVDADFSDGEDKLHIVSLGDDMKYPMTTKQLSAVTSAFGVTDLSKVGKSMAQDFTPKSMMDAISSYGDDGDDAEEQAAMYLRLTNPESGAIDRLNFVIGYNDSMKAGYSKKYTDSLTALMNKMISLGVVTQEDLDAAQESDGTVAPTVTTQPGGAATDSYKRFSGSN